MNIIKALVLTTYYKYVNFQIGVQDWYIDLTKSRLKPTSTRFTLFLHIIVGVLVWLYSIISELTVGMIFWVVGLIFCSKQERNAAVEYSKQQIQRVRKRSEELYEQT